jgi:hypothetical protein
MAYEDFYIDNTEQRRRRAAERAIQKQREKAQKTKVIDTVGNVAALLATIKGGPAAGALVRGMTGVAKGVATKDAGEAVKGGVEAVAGYKGMGSADKLMKGLRGAQSLDAANALLKNFGGIDKLDADQQAEVMKLLGKFK